MAPSFNLRPVSMDASPSPSPTASGSPSDAYNRKSPTSPAPPSASTSRAGPRRPLSPSSLRDVDLTHMSDSALHPRRYPAPPTGHDLMALFPPPAPDSFPELRPGPTSGYFQRQERAFFAQAGKEIVRVRVDVDVDPESSAMSVKVQSQQQRGPAPRSWPPSTSTPGAPHPRQHTRGPSVPVTPVFPPAPHPHPSSHTTPHLHAAHPHASPHPHSAHPPHLQSRARTPAPGPPSSSLSAASLPSTLSAEDRERDRGGEDGDGFRTDDPDEAWRRPMPYNERRRAGKHTRRVVVRT